MMGVYNLHVSWNMEDVCYGHLRRILVSVAVFEHFLDIFRVSFRVNHNFSTSILAKPQFWLVG